MTDVETKDSYLHLEANGAKSSQQALASVFEDLSEEEMHALEKKRMFTRSYS